jgi:hypothetical protein
MDAIDRLLAELKTANTNSSPPNPPPLEALPEPASMRSLDDVLRDITEETRLAIRSQLSQQHQAPPVSRPPALPTPNPIDDHLITQLGDHYAARDQAERLQHEQALKAAELEQQRQTQAQQQRLEALRVKRRGELTLQAQKWLKALNPKSSEGLWFDEFACAYNSRLEAAIDYLEALQDVDRIL